MDQKSETLALNFHGRISNALEKNRSSDLKKRTFLNLFGTGLGLWILFGIAGMGALHFCPAEALAVDAEEAISDDVEEILDLDLEDLETEDIETGDDAPNALHSNDDVKNVKTKNDAQDDESKNDELENARSNATESERERAEASQAAQVSQASQTANQTATPSEPESADAETSGAKASGQASGKASVKLSVKTSGSEKSRKSVASPAGTKKAADRTKGSSSVAPLNEVLPGDAAIVIRISSVREFNEKIEKLTETNFLKLLKTLGKGDYAKQLEPDLPAGVVLFPIQNTFQWTAALPMKRYRKFIELLGAQVDETSNAIPDGTVSVISETLAVMPYRGYAILAANPSFLVTVQKSLETGKSVRFTPCAVKNPVLSVEVTENFIHFLVKRGRIGMEEFTPVFTPEMKALQQGNEQLALAERILERVNDSIARLDENVTSARLDFTVSENETIVSGSYLPKKGSRLDALIHDPYRSLLSNDLGGDEFLKIVPLYPAFLAGQMDVSPASSEKLDAPFNRIRHVEYSLMTPPEGGRLAEAWCFLLEVDDSQAFIQEMLIPRAEAVGGQFGANTLGEIGRNALQTMAQRREARQLGRGRAPRANPELAASRGEAIGGWLGGMIGSNAARKEAMKVQNFMGYDLYSSDLVQYTQLLKRIREQEAGTAPPAQLGLGMRPGETLGSIISGLINGDINLNLNDALHANLAEFSYETPGDPPLIATRNFILALGPNHLLIVPGNDVILYEAVVRWQKARDKYLPPEPPKTEEELWRRASLPQYPFQSQRTPEDVLTTGDPRWQNSFASIWNSFRTTQNHTLRFAFILNADEAKRTLDFASQTYQFNVPENIQNAIPENLPPILTLYTTSANCGNLYLTLPHEISREQFQKLFIQLPALLKK